MPEHDHMKHHPNTSPASFVPYHSQGHDLPFNSKEFRAVLENKEFVPNENMSQFGLNNATQVMNYLASTEGKLVKSTIVKNIELMISLIEDNIFEAKEAMAQHRRTLVFLLMRYLHAKDHEKLEIQQLLQHALEEDHNLPEPTLANDTRLAYEDMIRAYEKDIEQQQELNLELEKEIENLKAFERQFEDLIENTDEESEDLEKNPGEAFGEILMALALEFSEQIESELEQTNKQIDSLQQKSGRSPQLKGPQPTLDVRELHRLKAKQSLQNETLTQIKQTQENIAQIQQSQKTQQETPKPTTNATPTPTQTPTPQVTPEPNPTLRQESKKLLNTLQHHLQNTQINHSSLGTNIARLSTERNKLSNQEKVVLKQYDMATQKLQNNAPQSRPEMKPRNGYESPKPGHK